MLILKVFRVFFLIGLSPLISQLIYGKVGNIVDKLSFKSILIGTVLKLKLENFLKDYGMLLKALLRKVKVANSRIIMFIYLFLDIVFKKPFCQQVITCLGRNSKR